MISAAVDLAGDSAASSKDSTGLTDSGGADGGGADRLTALSSFTVLSDSTLVEAVTGSFDSEAGGGGELAAGAFGLQSLVEEVW